MLRSTIFFSLLVPASFAHAQSMVETCTPLTVEYCYTDDLDTTATYYCQEPLSAPLVIVFCAGHMETLFDTLQIYNGPDVSYPMLFSGSLNDFSGLSAESINQPNAITVRIISDETISCESQNFVPLTWVVGPNGSTNCNVGVEERNGTDAQLTIVQERERTMLRWPIASGSRAWIEYIDLSGRTIAGRNIDFDGAGTATMATDALPTGIAILRITAKGRQAVARSLVIR